MQIRLKLFLCLVAVLGPLIAVAAFAIHLLDRQLAERTEAALSNTQRLEAARINQILAGHAHKARSLAGGAHVRNFVTEIHQYRNSTPDSQKNTDSIIGGYDGLAIVDPQSDWPLQQLALRLQGKGGMVESSVVQVRLVDRAGNTLGESIDFSWQPVDPKLVERSMRTVKTLYGDAFRNENEEDKLGIVSPIVSAKGAVVGALMMETQLDSIINHISKHEGVGLSSEAHIAQPTMTGDAQFITPLRFDKLAAFRRTIPIESRLPVTLALHSPESQVIKAKDYRGVESYLAIQTIPHTGWGLIVKIDAEEAFAPVTALRYGLGIVTLLSAACIIFIYLIWMAPVASRLKKTAAAATKIKNGDLTVRIEDGKKDEIADMVNSINSLAHDLEQDQKKRSRVEAKLRHQALHDELTGLLNRKHANKVIEKLTKHGRHPNSVAFLDLNGFKDVNDLFGHTVGDEVLKVVAERLTAETPEGATLARWGGDEFVVILPDINSKQAEKFSRQLHTVFEMPIVSSNGSHDISCSIGLATSCDNKNLEEALIEADTLMYEQKNRQRFSRSRTSVLAKGVERALIEDRLEIWYQPILEIQRPGNYQLKGASVQARIRSSEGGYVMPGEFMPEIANNILAVELDTRLISLTIQALNRWNMAGIVNDKFRLAIQLTDLSLNESAFAKKLHAQLNRNSVSTDQIIIELPRNSIERNKQTIHELKDLGCILAIDSSYTEPNILNHLPSVQPDLALVGRSWQQDSIVFPHLLSIYRELGIHVLAQSVDSREQLTHMHELGITQFQGDLFEKPLTAVDFVSRWGQTRLTGLGKTLTEQVTLRLAV